MFLHSVVYYFFFFILFQKINLIIFLKFIEKYYKMKCAQVGSCESIPLILASIIMFSRYFDNLKKNYYIYNLPRKII